MTQVRNHATIRTIKDITISSTLVLALMGGIQSCSSDNGGAEGSYDTEEAEVYTKGVKTYIKEVSKGEFKIIDEQKVPIDSALAIVMYIDGKQDTLKPELAKALIDKDMSQNYRESHYYGHHNSLSNVLLYGGMGYMLSRMMGGGNNQYYNYRQNFDRQNNGSGSAFYASPKVYESSKAVHESVGSSKVTVSRPVGSKSGFFHGSSHVSHVG
jgi:hypothetical protein